MAQTINEGIDVVAFLKGQHEQIKALFEELLAASLADREEIFFQLRRLLAVHETAEEEIVHPVAKRELTGGAEIIAARLKEENEAKTVLTLLEKVDIGSVEFESKCQMLKAAVLAHAEAEEKLEFDVLGKQLGADRLERLRRATELAEMIAPTRPHPGVESAIGNLLGGPFVAMVDRFRDALGTSKRHKDRSHTEKRV